MTSAPFTCDDLVDVAAAQLGDHDTVRTSMPPGIRPPIGDARCGWEQGPGIKLLVRLRQRLRVRFAGKELQCWTY